MNNFQMKEWRKKMGWTQQKTADELGYQRPSTIAQMESGILEPSKRVMLACKYLESKKPL